jgi:ArsR family transcriptional regulator, arsenate/arsenite/antimonite-responsive transcriptional repressor / arsenate reductase (thioredoxin)
MDLKDRARRHAALGDARRLLIVDHLALGDHTVAELGELVGMPDNLLAHHLDVLADADLIERRVSEGDGRRRYVTLGPDQLPIAFGQPREVVGRVAFVCTHNSARSQFASSLWEQLTGVPASSAGTEPADQVHPKAVRVASELGVDIAGRRPAGYETLPDDVDVLISVCDRANEAAVPSAVTRLHWSVPDPVPVGTLAAFRSSFGEIARRMEQLVGMVGA